MGQPRDAHDNLQPHAVEPEPEEEPDEGDDERQDARNPGGDATDTARRHRPG